MNQESQNGTAFYLAAIDGGYCALRRGTDLRVLYASPRVGQLLHVNSISCFTDFLSEEDQKAFFNAFKPAGLFSVRCQLRYSKTSFIPVTLKCNTMDNIIYCLITTQIDWYNYAIGALKTKRSYDRLLEYTDSYLFETDLSWNLISYTGKIPLIMPVEYATANLATFLTDENYVSPECATAVQHILAINTLFVVDTSEKVKIKFQDKWTWFELHIQSVVNKNTNKIDGIVGSFINIDAYQNNIVNVNRALSKDPVTGSFQKAYLFNDMVVKTLSKDSWFAFFNIEDLNEIYETYGQDANDAVLREVAQKIKKIFAPTPGLICRYGDSEFTVYMPKVTKDRLDSLINEFMRDIKRIELDGRFPLSVTVCAVKNNGQKSMHRLIDKADNSLYKVKSQFKGKYRIIDE